MAPPESGNDFLENIVEPSNPTTTRLTYHLAAVLAEVCWWLLSACYHGSPPGAEFWSHYWNALKRFFFFVFSQS
jgi:hypothetical protein